MALVNSIANLGRATSFGDVLSSVDNISLGVGGWIKKLKSDDPNKMDSATIRDLNLNGFASQSSIHYKPTYFARAFDEPTYLTFRIEFMFDDHMRNIAFNNQGVFNSALENAAYTNMYDYMPEPFLESQQKVKTVSYSNSSKYTVNPTYPSDDSSIGTTYSTEQYLDIALGDHGRAYMLHAFKDALKDIQNVFPFYLHSISGISDLLKVDPGQGIRLKDAKIEISCLEGLDLKITQLLNLYRKIVWDDVYQRWVLPDMMRYFGMKIYISEIRMFHDLRPDNAKGEDYLYDFTLPTVKNSTVGQFNKQEPNLFGKVKNGLNTATAVSNNYLGTKSVLTKAINMANSTVQTATDVYGNIASALTDMNLCNSAFNEVMPTICLECHMCEFDITDTMSHLSSLKSARSTSPEPKIKIKVGQVKETHAYPLNTSLRNNNEKYLATVAEHVGKMSKTDFGKNYSDWVNARDASSNIYTYVGNYISDEALREKYKSNTFYRFNEYVENLSATLGAERSGTILSKRYPQQIIDNLDNMTKSKSASSQELTNMAMTSAGLQEATAILQMVDKSADFDSEIITGTHSTATSPDQATRQSVKAVGDMLNDALDRIYNGTETKAMGLSEPERNKIASEMFSNYIETLDQNAEDNTALKEILKHYKACVNEPEFQSTATQTIQNETVRNSHKFNELN